MGISPQPAISDAIIELAVIARSDSDEGNPICPRGTMDFFVEPVIGPRVRATRRLAMTIQSHPIPA
jgi:hypothetical protein